jgi:hypothetical protein
MLRTKARSKLWKWILGSRGAELLRGIGGTMSTADITFTTNPSVGDTITINRHTFTFVDTISTGDNINIKSTLELTLTEAELVIESQVTNIEHELHNIIANVDVTGTSDNILSFEFFPNRTVHKFNSYSGTASDITQGNSAPIIDISKSECIFMWGDAGENLTYVELPDGIEDGQLLSMFISSLEESKDSIGMFGHFNGGNLTSSVNKIEVGDYIQLFWDNKERYWNNKLELNAMFTYTYLKDLT